MITHSIEYQFTSDMVNDVQSKIMVIQLALIELLGDAVNPYPEHQAIFDVLENTLDLCKSLNNQLRIETKNINIPDGTVDISLANSTQSL